MAVVIGAIIFGIIFSFFATQNTQTVSISFAQYHYSQIPLYLVILISLLLGVILAWLLSFTDYISSFLKLQGKDAKIKKFNQKEAELTKTIHKLELENASLKTSRNDQNTDDKSH